MIPKEDVDLLEKILTHTDLADNEQLLSLEKLAPGLIGYSKFTGKENPVHIDFYSRYDTKLNKELSRVLNIDNDTPLTIHTVNYEIGAQALEHRDENSFNTFVLMLDDNYEGGNFYVEDKIIEFNTRGDVVHYIGWKTRHRVVPVTKGTRKVLVVWYGSDEKHKTPII